MIRFDSVTFTYPEAMAPALADVDLCVPEGELCLVVGSTGSGKSTLLRAVNGLVPRFTGGRLAGRVTVAGRGTDEHPPRELADVVGMVGQDPAASFVSDTVEEELAYVMENLGMANATMRRRVEDVLDLLGLADVRDRPLATLSSGQQQRVAIGAVLTASPSVLVLDEPTSALDPAGAEDVLAGLTRLVHDLGTTVLVAEHRLERVVQFADSVVLVDRSHAGGPAAPAPLAQPVDGNLQGTGAGPGRGNGDRPRGPGRVVHGAAREVFALSPVVPPVVALGRLAGWSPLPLSVRDARRASAGLRSRLDAVAPPAPRRTPGHDVASMERVVAAYGPVVALRGVDLRIARGEVTAIMGRNGSGKSTLLALLAGMRRPASGSVTVDGHAPATRRPADLVRSVGFVPSDPALLLSAGTVGDECAAADRDAGAPHGTARSVLDSLVAGIDAGSNPRDLSEGQRLALALAVVLAARPPLVLLDEPTRGLDYDAKRRLVAVVDGLAAAGHAVVLSTHDAEVVAQVADRAVVLAEGEVVADGAARDVVCDSPVFAPQVAKILAPLEWLTVDEVSVALAAIEGTPR